MKVGTRTLLFGYHNLLLHGLFVWRAWTKLYGWTWDPRIVLSLFLHDIGYWGKPNMDGLEGKRHPWLWANIAYKLFDGWVTEGSSDWYKFNLYHSRTLASLYIASPSRLCYADKLAFLLCPAWLIWLLCTAGGELKEYRSLRPQTTSFAEWCDLAREENVKTLKEAGLWK